MNYFRTAMLLAGLTALFMGVGYLIGGQTGAMIALVIAAGMNLFSYWNSDRMVLSMHGAQEVDARTAPDLYRLVQDLAGRAQLPMPRVYLMDNPQPNAFATGRDPDHAAVAVTTGLMNALTREEVAGVVQLGGRLEKVVVQRARDRVLADGWRVRQRREAHDYSRGSSGSVGDCRVVVVAM